MKRAREIYQSQQAVAVHFPLPPGEGLRVRGRQVLSLSPTPSPQPSATAPGVALPPASMQSSPGGRGSAGLTLVEMMVSLLITTVLLGGVVQIFASTKQSHKLTDSLGFMQESGRMAINLISTDLRRAGYLGGNKDIRQMANGTIDPVAPTAANFNTCTTGNNTWALLFAQRVFGLDDTRNGYACVPVTGGSNGYLRGDVLAVRYANAQDASGAEVGTTLYVRSTLAAGRVFLGANTAAAANQLTGLPVAVYPLEANAYYVGAGSDTCNGASIPALHQVNIGANGQPQTREIAAGVEDLQVQYGWDSDADGIANRYLDADALATTAATFTDWNYPGVPTVNTVVSARVWIIARSACADANYTDTNTYIYADKTTASPYRPADHYRRQVYSATIALRN